MKPTLTDVLRDAAARLMRSLTTGAGADTSGDEPVQVPGLSTVDDTQVRDPATSDDEPERARKVQPPSDWDGSVRNDTADGDNEDAAASPDDTSANEDAGRDQRRMDRDDDGMSSPGQVGASATVEVDPRALLQGTIDYNPDLNGRPDPGEVVWTWVPYVEADGRGKDRPVMVLAREDAGTVLCVYLSSTNHQHDNGWVELGAGGWDREGRVSWANLDRILRVHPDGMRREGDIVDEDDFNRLVHKVEGV